LKPVRWKNTLFLFVLLWPLVRIFPPLWQLLLGPGVVADSLGLLTVVVVMVYGAIPLGHRAVGAWLAQ